MRWVPKKKPKGPEYIYFGWIGGREEDRAALERMGVNVGTWNKEATTFDNCTAEPRVMALLKVMWRRKWCIGMIMKKKSEFVTEKPEDDPDLPF